MMRLFFLLNIATLATDSTNPQSEILADRRILNALQSWHRYRLQLISFRLRVRNVGPHKFLSAFFAHLLDNFFDWWVK